MVLQLAIIALIEEIAFRGYLQNKLLALSRHRLGSAAAVTMAITISAALFALWHVPAWDLTQPWTAHLPLLGMLFGTGVVFGVIYYLSGNLYLVAVLHALGNTWRFAFDMAGWPVWALVAFWTLAAVLYGAAVGVCLRLQRER